MGAFFRTQVLLLSSQVPMISFFINLYNLKQILVKMIPEVFFFGVCKKLYIAL